MEWHEAAAIFPLMSDEETTALALDIRAHGQQMPIEVCEGKIIDGRNRWRAFEWIRENYDDYEEPDIIEVDPNDAVAYVVSLNLKRRHLTPSQAACAAVKANELMAKIKTGTPRGRPKKNTQLIGELTAGRHDREADAKLAETMGTNRQYVSDARKLKESEPELFEQVESGEKTITQARREEKERNREKRRQENAAKVVEVVESGGLDSISAKFATITIDPPWDWGDESDQDQLGRARPTYQTMSFDELLGLPVELVADVDRHIYLWITNRSLPKGFALLEAWG